MKKLIVAITILVLVCAGYYYSHIVEERKIQADLESRFGSIELNDAEINALAEKLTGGASASTQMPDSTTDTSTSESSMGLLVDTEDIVFDSSNKISVNFYWKDDKMSIYAIADFDRTDSELEWIRMDAFGAYWSVLYDRVSIANFGDDSRSMTIMSWFDGTKAPSMMVDDTYEAYDDISYLPDSDTYDKEYLYVSEQTTLLMKKVAERS